MSSKTPLVHSSPTQVTMWNRLRAWNRAHPELWISVVLFAASCLFVSAFGWAAHRTQQLQTTRLADYCRWDCAWYSSIVNGGYDQAPHRELGNPANWAFFPLFPLTASACVHVFAIDAHSAAVVASKIEYFTAILAFLLWMEPHLESLNQRFFAGMLVAFNPYLIYGHAGYSEPLYFSLACVGFWMLERQKWVLAGLSGACLSANRPVGILFALAYAIAALREVGWRSILRDSSLRVPIGAALCPLGLVLYSIYLYHRAGDALAFVHIEVAWERASANPFVVMLHSYQTHGWFRVWSLMAVVGLAASAWIARRRPEYGVFLAASIILPLSSGLPWSLARYIWWQPPLLYAIFLWLRRWPLTWMIYLAFAGGMASFMVIEWFMGTNIVV